MTEIKTTKPIPVPSREEFHKEFAGEVTGKDFEIDRRFSYRTYGYSYPTNTEIMNWENR